jgi:S1-C subfamily serine protease
MARPTSTRTYATAAAGGNDEEEDGLPDESDAPEPSPTTDTWRSNGQEPPPPPAKHPTQLDLTGLPAKVMGSVFKLKVTSCPPLFRRPWSRQPTSTSFSTAWAYDVKEKLLLTNSHCVMDAVVINVKKPGNSNLFKAEVLGKSDHSDLALLRVPDEGFWEGVEAIRMEPEDVKLGELVTVIGYPRGGEKICLTKGIVSRLHFNGEYLSIQIDAVRTREGREGARERGREEGYTS